MGAPGRPRKCDPEVALLRANIKFGENDKAISILKKHGIDSTDGEGSTALIHAVIYKNERIFDWALLNGANVNAKDRTGYTPLHSAAYNNSFEYAKRLLENGADPNIQDNHGNIPLWTAIFNSQVEISNTTRLLLKYHSNVELNNNYGENCRIMFRAFFKRDISRVDVSFV